MTNGSKVTLKDIYDIVDRMETKIDKRMCDIEDRVGILEEFKGRALGTVGVVSALIASGLSFVWHEFFGQK